MAFYLVAYTVTILTTFGVITVLSTSEADADDLEDYRGLFWRRPVLASVFTAALLSLAGIPATMGFVAKFYILASGADVSAWPLIIVLVLTSVIGLLLPAHRGCALLSSAGASVFATKTRVVQRFRPRWTRGSAHTVWRVPRAIAQSYPGNDKWARLVCVREIVGQRGRDKGCDGP